MLLKSRDTITPSFQLFLLLAGLAGGVTPSTGQAPSVPIEQPAPAPARASSSSADASDPVAHFVGDWAGQLEYRDYQSDGQVVLPTWLSIHEEAGQRLTFAYTYDDGPAKVVHETEDLTLSKQGDKAIMVSEPDGKRAIYAVTGLAEFSRANRGKLVLTGKGTDNNKPAELRITITLSRNLLHWLRETRPEGSKEPFTFRDAYTLTRAQPPQP